MADGERRGEDRNTKILISRVRKELSGWNKKHYYNYLKLSFGEKTKNSGHNL